MLLGRDTWEKNQEKSTRNAEVLVVIEQEALKTGFQRIPFVDYRVTFERKN